MLAFAGKNTFPGTLRYFSIAVYKSNFHKGPWNILYFGTDQFAVRPLDRLNSLRVNSSLIDNIEVVCPIEKRREKDIKQQNQALTVRQLAEVNGLTIHNWPLDRKNLEFLLRFHLGIVVSFGHFLPSWIINNLQCGAINIHPSLLPKWRGPSPIVHTLLNGDTETGVSIIEVSPKKFDAGKILSQNRLQIPPNTPYDELADSLSALSSKMLVDVLANFNELRTSAIAQDEREVTEAPKLLKETSYIKWGEFTCGYIQRLSCATRQRFGLKCKWNNQIVTLGKLDICSTSLPGPPEDAVVGQPYYDCDENLLFIKCKDGWVGWKSLKMQHRKSITARDFYNGYLVDKNTEKTTSTLFQNMT
ncbi:methionyl-tRNA formyltransferase, mitochondrial-like [Dendronephthya gigantea]|uniref:methionyl-tRNA formyltransferase, mitochondrial-like n=1 Tax=Dendronephthya gigantea TaxID=151771 RepID=UPI00106C5A9A|nr:methionyl-tRNA formyltransferase, mitochondrial-like [Dendronephthya gigantea]